MVGFAFTGVQLVHCMPYGWLNHVKKNLKHSNEQASLFSNSSMVIDLIQNGGMVDLGVGTGSGYSPYYLTFVFRKMVVVISTSGRN
jgi:hypothetical protein